MPPPDVVVIGAGLAGCAAAWHLAASKRVLVLEQGPTAGAEASAQNAGMVRLLGEDPSERALAMRTHAFLTRPGADWAGLEVSRRTGAVLALSHDPWHLHDGVAHLRAHGVDVRAVAGEALGQLAPALAGAPVRQAWWLPEARVADPHAVLTGYRRGIVRMGSQLRFGVQVRRLEQAGGRVRLHVAAGADGAEGSEPPIDADAVVLAAGAWSAQLAETLGVQRPLFPLRRTLLTTHAHPASAPDHPWCWIDDAGLYVRPEGAGWLVSACDEAVDPPRAGPGTRGSPQPTVQALALDKLSRLMPALADAQLAGGWTGLRTFAADRAPLLGADPDVPGLWWAGALGGFGVTCSYGVGEALAHWMSGREVPWLHRESVSPGRHLLRRFPIRPQGELHRPRLIDARRAPRRRTAASDA